MKVRCEGDRGRPIYAVSTKPGEAEAALFEDAVYIFVVLHSDAQVLIKVRDKKESGFYGQVRTCLHWAPFCLHAGGKSTSPIASPMHVY